jgi:hypothetical protein
MREADSDLYLVECFWPDLTEEETDRAAERARLCAEALSREGKRVRFVRSLLVPKDEVVFFLFESPSRETVGEASRRAGIRYERILASRERA